MNSNLSLSPLINKYSTGLTKDIREKFRVVDLKGKTCRTCIWALNKISVKKMWMLISETLKHRIKYVLKIVKVTQKNRSDKTQTIFRYDVYSDITKPKVFRRLKTASSSNGWYCRKHKSWKKRHNTLTHIDISPDDEDRVEDIGIRNLDSSIPIGTWKICSLGQKRPQLEDFLRKTKMGILGLQETRRAASGWRIRIKGYQTFESVAVPGHLSQVGLALLVTEEISAYEIGDPSPYYVAVKVSLGVESWVIITCYVPNSPNKSLGLNAIRNLLNSLNNNDLGTNSVLKNVV